MKKPGESSNTLDLRPGILDIEDINRGCIILSFLASAPCPDTIIDARTADGPSRSACLCRSIQRAINPTARGVAPGMPRGLSLRWGFWWDPGEGPAGAEEEAAAAAATRDSPEPIDFAVRFGRVRRPVIL